jgi:MFS family permease
MAVVAPLTVFSDTEILEIQRRTLRVLVVGQIAGSAALSAAVTVGAFVVQDILGQQTPWGGIASATVTIGTAFMAQLLSRLMLRQGRRRGLMLGYSLALFGGLIAGFGVERQSLRNILGRVCLGGICIRDLGCSPECFSSRHLSMRRCG